MRYQQHGASTRLGLGVQIANLRLQVFVLILQLGKGVLYEVEELIHLVFVVAALANGRLAERDVVNISW